METGDLPKGLASSNSKKILTKLKSISGGKILDVATNEGGFIDTVMKALKDYDSFVGIDFSKKAIKSAKKRFERQPLELLKMNAEALKFENNSFDTVCISHSLNHLDEINEVLVEMKPELKPGGYFLIQETFSNGEQTEAQKTESLQHH